MVSLALGACSAAGPVTQSASWSATQSPPPAVVGIPSVRRWLVEIEEDGIAGQRPPRRRMQETPPPDDPTEPFSPNYGSAPPPPQAAAGSPA